MHFLFFSTDIMVMHAYRPEEEKLLNGKHIPYKRKIKYKNVSFENWKKYALK